LASVRQTAARAGPAPAVEAAAPATEAPAPTRRPWWRRRWLAVVVAAAALVAALAVPGALLLGDGDGGEVTRLALVAVEGGGRGEVTVTQTAAGRSFDVRIEGLRPPPAGSLYELWAVHPRDTLERPSGCRWAPSRPPPTAAPA
jgi:hypothetical protein